MVWGTPNTVTKEGGSRFLKYNTQSIHHKSVKANLVSQFLAEVEKVAEGLLTGHNRASTPLERRTATYRAGIDVLHESGHAQHVFWVQAMEEFLESIRAIALATSDAIDWLSRQSVSWTATAVILPPVEMADMADFHQICKVNRRQTASGPYPPDEHSVNEDARKMLSSIIEAAGGGKDAPSTENDSCLELWVCGRNRG